jgi:hypothetical protein
MQIRLWGWEVEGKQPSGVKTPLLEGRLIAGVETPDCHSRPANVRSKCL